MIDQTLPQTNVSQTGQQPSSPISSNKPPEDKKGLLLEILLVVIALILIFGVLNYFNILRISEIFPNYLGFLPRKEVPTGTSQQLNNATITPTTTSSTSEQAKQILINYLSHVLVPSLLVPSSDITLTQEKESGERFTAQWTTKDGVSGVSFTSSSDLKKIISLDFGLNKVESASWSEELGKTTIPQFFSIKPEGQWGCKPALAKRLYCENFWEEKDSKRGLGFLIVPINTSSRIAFFFCEHTKESPYYGWKSCISEFAKSGVR